MNSLVWLRDLYTLRLIFIVKKVKLGLKIFTI